MDVEEPDVFVIAGSEDRGVVDPLGQHDGALESALDPLAGRLAGWPQVEALNFRFRRWQNPLLGSSIDFVYRGPERITRVDEALPRGLEALRVEARPANRVDRVVQHQARMEALTGIDQKLTSRQIGPVQEVL